MDSSRGFSWRAPVSDNADADERAAILGLETEYAVLYTADSPDDARRPDFALIQRLLFEALLAERKAATSAGLKGGYFLENGGLIHLEVCLRHQGDTPILEAATPECRSPWDVVVYSRAFDEILELVSRRLSSTLRLHGFHGRVVFAKNNRDSRGVGYGCHENYLVRLKPTRLEKFLVILTLPFILLCLLPSLAILVVLLVLACSGLLLAKLSPRLRDLAVGFYRGFLLHHRLAQNALAFYYVISGLLLLPAITLYAWTLRLLAFRPFVRDLASFLVTRQILTGTGCLNFAARVYETSQRAELTSSLASIVMFGRRKTIFDLKGLLYEPLSVFRPVKKLSLTCGDSTLSDVSTLLKLGPTALILEMVEYGVSFANLRLANPVAAFRYVSRHGPWKTLRLKNGGELRAIDIQREYLRLAREFFDGRQTGRLRAGEILDLWEEHLDRLSERPYTLAERLDWAAKKALLDAAVRVETNWTTFFAWGSIFDAEGLASTAAAASYDELLRSVPRWRRGEIEQAAARDRLDPAEFSAQRRLYFQARTIDLRYHEISDTGGYQRELERDGHILRLTSDEAVERATREAPQDTRARIRGYYIQLSPSPESLHVNWTDIELLSPMRHISTANPFAHHLPGE